MNRKENAVNYFKQSFNCSQSVFTAYRQTDKMDEKTALKLSTIYGAGVASTGKELCGAVTGALMAISMKFGREDVAGIESKMRTYELGRQFMEKFSKNQGSCICDRILGINIGTPENMKKATEMNLFATKCLGAVKTASDILEEMGI
jgi:C_GCAxxG_C_C family probable redox protein